MKLAGETCEFTWALRRAELEAFVATRLGAKPISRPAADENGSTGGGAADFSAMTDLAQGLSCSLKVKWPGSPSLKS